MYIKYVLQIKLIEVIYYIINWINVNVSYWISFFYDTYLACALNYIPYNKLLEVNLKNVTYIAVYFPENSYVRILNVPQHWLTEKTCFLLYAYTDRQKFPMFNNIILEKKNKIFVEKNIQVSKITYSSSFISFWNADSKLIFFFEKISVLCSFEIVVCISFLENAIKKE